jgi:hypothetical protein
VILPPLVFPAISHYLFVMHGFHSKLVCLSKPVNVVKNKKDTSLLRNLSIVRTLRTHMSYSTGPWWQSFKTRSFVTDVDGK